MAKQRRWWPKQYAGMQQAYPAASADTVRVYQGEMGLLAQKLLDLVQMQGAQFRYWMSSTLWS